MFKLVPFFAVLAVTRAGILQHAAPVAVAQQVLTKSVDEYDPHPQYNFGYDVQDALSGDSKNQVESRDGDVVQGQYSLNDADGYRRIVDYSADPVNGFNAVVRREPLHVKALAAAPALVKSAPLALAAPAAPILRSSPFASYAAGPTLVKSAPLATYAAAAPAYATTSYAAPAAYASYAAPAAYASYAAPAAYASYAAPSLIKSAPLATYAAAPAAYSFAAPGLIKSAPIASYAAPLASGAIVKTAYSSPIASYHY